jgi:hypothetical protein
VLLSAQPIGWLLKMAAEARRGHTARIIQPLPLQGFLFLSHQSIPGARWDKDKI